MLNLTIGLPDFDTPEYIKERAKRAIDVGYTRYTHNAGMIEVRRVIAKKLKHENGITANPEDEIICTSGGMGGLVLANMVLVNPGDEVIYPDPGFVTHYPHIKLAGGVPVSIRLRPENEFGVSSEELESLITPKTKLLVLNSPNNPTGGVTSNKELKRILELAIEHDFYILSDEAYEHFRYDNEKPLFIGSLPGAKERVISVFSFSKTYAMTGWRIGFCTGPSELIKAMTKIQELLVAHPSSISQKAAHAALRGPQDDLENMIRVFRKRRDLIVRGLAAIDGVNVVSPNGAFYVFPDVSAYGLKSYDLVMKMIKEIQVATVHGTAFGNNGEGFIRICYAVSETVIEEALSRMDRFFPSLLN